MFVTAALFAVEAFTAVSTQGTLTGVTGFTGMLLAYTGLLGLYPWFAARSPRSARVGISFVALPTLVSAALLMWGIATHLSMGAVPSPIDIVPSVGLVLLTTFLLVAVGVGVFGLASLRTGIPSRDVGLLLLGLAAMWVMLLGASFVYEITFPPWLDVVTFGKMAVALTGIGFSLRAGASLDDYTEQAPDSIE